jgi:hypothetical protein
LKRLVQQRLTSPSSLETNEYFDCLRRKR